MFSRQEIEPYSGKYDYQRSKRGGLYLARTHSLVRHHPDQSRQWVENVVGDKDYGQERYGDSHALSSWMKARVSECRREKDFLAEITPDEVYKQLSKLQPLDEVKLMYRTTGDLSSTLLVSQRDMDRYDNRDLLGLYCSEYKFVLNDSSRTLPLCICVDNSEINSTVAHEQLHAVMHLLKHFSGEKYWGDLDWVKHPPTVESLSLLRTDLPISSSSVDESITPLLSMAKNEILVRALCGQEFVSEMTEFDGVYDYTKYVKGLSPKLRSNYWQAYQSALRSGMKTLSEILTAYKKYSPETCELIPWILVDFPVYEWQYFFGVNGLGYNAELISKIESRISGLKRTEQLIKISNPSLLHLIFGRKSAADYESELRQIIRTTEATDQSEKLKKFSWQVPAK